jgi:hypothetical protein
VRAVFVKKFRNSLSKNSWLVLEWLALGLVLVMKLAYATSLPAALDR